MLWEFLTVLLVGVLIGIYVGELVDRRERKK
jgi:hypothetical protein